MRQPAVGDLRGHTDVGRAEGCDVNWYLAAHQLVEELQGFAKLAALLARQWHVDDAMVVDHLTSPDPAAQFDGLAGAAERLVVRQAVPALDDLRAGRAEPEQGTAPGYRVESGGGLGDQRGRARVHVDDVRADFHALGAGGEVAHSGRRVETVRLGHPDGVEPGLLQPHDLLDGLPRVVLGILKGGGEFHGFPLRARSRKHRHTQGGC